jgi:hypothetical protein
MTRFAVTLTGPRTTPVTFDSWQAYQHRNKRTLAAYQVEVPGTIGGAHYEMLWIEASDWDAKNEPTITAQRRRRKPQDWARTQFPQAAMRTIEQTFARAFLTHGGFNDVWESVYRSTTVVTHHQRINTAAETYRDFAAWLDECAELGRQLEQGHLTVVPLERSETNAFGSNRVPSVQDPFNRNSLNPPAARLFDANQHVGWINEHGTPTPLRTRPNAHHL